MPDQDQDLVTIFEAPALAGMTAAEFDTLRRSGAIETIMTGPARFRRADIEALAPQQKAKREREIERRDQEREQEQRAAMARAQSAEPPWPNLSRETPHYDAFSYYERGPALAPLPEIPGLPTNADGTVGFPVAPEPVRRIVRPRAGALTIDEGRALLHLLHLSDDLFDFAVNSGALATFKVVSTSPTESDRLWFTSEYIQAIVADAATVARCRKHVLDARDGNGPALPFDPVPPKAPPKPPPKPPLPQSVELHAEIVRPAGAPAARAAKGVHPMDTLLVAPAAPAKAPAAPVNPLARRSQSESAPIDAQTALMQFVKALLRVGENTRSVGAWIKDALGTVHRRMGEDALLANGMCILREGDRVMVAIAFNHPFIMAVAGQGGWHPSLLRGIAGAMSGRWQFAPLPGTSTPFRGRGVAIPLDGPGGQTNGPSGHENGPGGQTNGPGGQTNGPGGHENGPGGQTNGPGGHENGPGGHEMGRAATKNGRAATPAGRAATD